MAAEPIRRPADIILIVDSTGSMGTAVSRIQEVINTQFAEVIGGAGIDYQVILLASGVEVGPPLATSGRFHQLAVQIGSGDSASFRQVLDTYPEWSGWLRPDAVKVFLHFTDSEGSGEHIDGTSGTFDEILVTQYPDQFGTVPGKRFVYHAIVGVKENAPATEPWRADAPIVTEACWAPEFVRTGPGVGYQAVAVRTGGLRFPVCQFPHFDVVFHTIADAVVDFSAPPCSLALPPPPPGAGIDASSVVVVFTDEATGAVTELEQVPGKDACRAGAFFLDGEEVELCEDTCAAVSANAHARLDVAFACDAEVE